MCRIFASLLATALLSLALHSLATDVAFWNEYHLDLSDAQSTYLLLQVSESRLNTTPPQKADLVGQPQIVPGPWLARGLRLDGRSAVRCIPTNVFEGGRVSLEAWVKLDRYPENEGCILYRPAAQGSVGFALLVDSQGALHLDTVNLSRRKIRVSSKPSAVPVNKWVHVAGICSTRRQLFVDGTQVADKGMSWGEGLLGQGPAESVPQPTYIGNNDLANSGITGLIDQARIHRNVHRFWAPEDNSWTDPAAARTIPDGPPYFAAEHAPTTYVSLDGDATVTGPAHAKAELSGNDFRPGVHGKAFAGKITITASNIFHADEGSIEFWMRPLRVNTLSDRNRTFLNEPFIFYLLNGGDHEPTIYFNVQDRGLHFVHAQKELHPARWFHWVFTWHNKEIQMFLDGAIVGGTTTQKLAPNSRATANRFVFNGSETIALLDEIRIYDRALLPNEIKNAFARYRDPSKLMRGIRLPSQQVQIEYFPSRRKLYYQLSPLISSTDFNLIDFELRSTNLTVLQKWQVPWNSGQPGELDIASLPEGNYVLANSVTRKSGAKIPGEAVEFYARLFSWEGNTLGITDEVFPPFTPVQVSNQTVSVVDRSMTMNNLGLWDQVVTLGRNILAAPMTIRFETATGEGQWTKSNGKFLSQKQNDAVFAGSAESGPVKITTFCTTEVDGCMKVTMTLLPGTAPAEIKKLWLEILLKNSEVPLMHTVGDGLRHNYSGAVPQGQGQIWNGTHVARSEPWRNAFVPYILLGAAERGLAFFAENDRGWVTEKARSKTPTHELIREGDRLTLRIYLINRPVTLQHSASALPIVFGLQASPTKPMAPNWRKSLPQMPGGLAVVPWGGIQCASQGPFGDDWTIVDKILEARAGQPFDTAWMENYVKENKPPLVHNESDWTYFMNHFVQRAKDVGLNRPLAVYQEEMRAAHSRPEWLVYQDEWRTQDGPATRTEAGPLDLRGGHRSFSPVSEITFPRSYADFGAWMANEWLKRGVSLYWDNTYLYPSYNTRTTAAYLAEDGQIQPALIIWNVREYHKRVWNLLQQNRRKRKEPLEWTLHMTNTELLPVHTWGTVQLDHELAVKSPFSPEWLMTETIGRQVGNCPLSLYEVYGRDNPVIKKLPKPQADRIEWGLRAVHELQRSGPMEKHLTEFGYGDDSVQVHNYWADEPALAVTPASVKWLTLSRTNEVLIVLASWSQEPVQAQVTLNTSVLHLDPQQLHAIDELTGNPITQAPNKSFPIDIPAPWGNRILRVKR